jgi:hypothetical protein
MERPCGNILPACPGDDPDIYPAITGDAMGNSAQKRALHNYRRRLHARGMARFEVLGLAADRELIRSLAKRLAAGDDGAARIRATMSRSVSGELSGRGGILGALRRSPLVGADLKLKRSRERGRKAGL